MSKNIWHKTILTLCLRVVTGLLEIFLLLFTLQSDHKLLVPALFLLSLLHGVTGPKIKDTPGNTGKYPVEASLSNMNLHHLDSAVFSTLFPLIHSSLAFLLFPPFSVAVLASGLKFLLFSLSHVGRPKNEDAAFKCFFLARSSGYWLIKFCIY